MIWRYLDENSDNNTISKFLFLPLKFKGVCYWLERVEITYKHVINEELDYHMDYIKVGYWEIVNIKRNK